MGILWFWFGDFLVWFFFCLFPWSYIFHLQCSWYRMYFYSCNFLSVSLWHTSSYHAAQKDNRFSGSIKFPTNFLKKCCVHAQEKNLWSHMHPQSHLLLCRQVELSVRTCRTGSYYSSPGSTSSTLRLPEIFLSRWEMGYWTICFILKQNSIDNKLTKNIFA